MMFSLIPEIKLCLFQNFCRKIVTSYGKMKLSESDADEMLAAADSDGDGQVLSFPTNCKE